MSSYKYEVLAKFSLNDVNRIDLGSNTSVPFTTSGESEIHFEISQPYDDFNTITLIDYNSITLAVIQLNSSIRNSDVRKFTATITVSKSTDRIINLTLSIDELYLTHHNIIDQPANHFKSALYKSDLSVNITPKFETEVVNQTADSLTPRSDTISLGVKRGYLGKASLDYSGLSDKKLCNSDVRFVASPKAALEAIFPSEDYHGIGYKTYLMADEFHGVFLVVVLPSYIIFIGSDRWPSIEYFRYDYFNIDPEPYIAPRIIRHFNSIFMEGALNNQNCVCFQRYNPYRVISRGQVVQLTWGHNVIRFINLRLSSTSDLGHVGYTGQGSAYDLLTGDPPPTLIDDSELDNGTYKFNPYYDFIDHNYDTLRSIVRSNQAAMKFANYFENPTLYRVLGDRIFYQNDKNNPTEFIVISTDNAPFFDFDHLLRGNRILTRIDATQFDLSKSLKFEFDSELIKVYNDDKVYTYNQHDSDPTVEDLHSIELNFRGMKVSITKDGEFV